MSTKYIGMVLRARRKEKQLSQVEMGKVLDVSTAIISQVESGEGKIAFHWIQDYLEAYGMSSECYPAFVKLLYPAEWVELLRRKKNLGEEWQALDDKVELLINSGQFR
jgi:transcriptional regulator with XRE-family HTH domain